MNRQSNFRECAAMFAIGLDIGYSNLKLAFGKVSDNGLAKPAVTRVLPTGAGRLSDLPLRMGKADGDTDALVVNVNGEKWAAGVDQARLETSVRELHADYPASDAYRALFHAALLMGEHDSVDQLITGLPVSSTTTSHAWAAASGLERTKRISTAWTRHKRAVALHSVSRRRNVEPEARPDDARSSVSATSAPFFPKCFP